MQNLLSEQVTLLVCSCDAYADLWAPFFTLLHTYWPGLTCRVVLNTETKDFAGGPVRVQALHPANPAAPYGQRMCECLARIDTPYTLPLLDDFFLRRPVEVDRLADIVRWMDGDAQVACTSFDWHVQKTDTPAPVPGFFRTPQCAMYKLNMQAGVWRTERLLHYWQSEDDPWRWELFVNYLTFDSADAFYAAESREASPLDYGYCATGMGVFRGKWVVADVAPLFAENGIEVDFSARGVYEPEQARAMMPVDLATARYMLNRIGLKTTLGLTLFTIMKKCKRALHIPLRYEFYPELLQARREGRGRRGRPMMHPKSDDSRPRILVYPFHFFPDANSVTNVAMPLLNELAKSYAVDVLAWRADRKGPRVQVQKGFTTYYFHAAFPMLRDRLLDYRYGEPATGGGVKRLIIGLFRKDLFFRPLYKLVCTCFTKPQRQLKRRLIAGGYRLLITVSSPITPLYDGLALAEHGVFKRHGICWVPYLVDPHATAIGLVNKRDILMPIEYEAYRHADAIITTPEQCEDNKRYPLGDFSYKTYPVPLANLRAISGRAPTGLFAPGKINCLYAGSFYNTIVRDPGYLLRLAAKCPEDIVIHVLCSYESAENRAMREALLAGRGNVIWHENLPLDECLDAICAADILMNLGNKCENQTPGKVFDYMGAGRPIVNFYDVEGDTSRRYLAAYPYVLHMQNKAEVSEEDVEAFARFCRENAGKRLPFETLARLYPDGTTDAVSARFVGYIDGLLRPGGA